MIMDAAILEAAPPSPIGPDGRPRLGAYRGYAGRVAWGDLFRAPWRDPWRLNPVWRTLHHKRWHYASVATERCVVAVAIIHVGYAASAFAYVFDRRERRLLADLSFTELPRAATYTDRPGPGARSRFSSRRASFHIERAQGAASWRVTGQGPEGLVIDATLDAHASPAPLCAIAAIDGGLANCTHKTVGLAATGEVVVAGARLPLTGGHGALDHTSGLLARDTRWRWASASSRHLSLNLVEGFNGPVENVVWIDDTLVPVGPVSFHYDRHATSRPWSIRAADGTLELDFMPEGERREDKDLGVAKSWYVQPIGTFSGVIRPRGRAPIEVNDLIGVTEDHVARW